MKQIFLKNIEDIEGREIKTLTEREKERFIFDTVQVDPLHQYSEKRGRKKQTGQKTHTNTDTKDGKRGREKKTQKETEAFISSNEETNDNIEIPKEKIKILHTEVEAQKQEKEQEEELEEIEVEKTELEEDIEEEMEERIEMDEIHREYFKSLKKDFAKYLYEEKHIIIAYNLNDLYSFEFLKKKYVIPPYHKGVILNYEVENEKIIIDVINKSVYIKEMQVDQFSEDTRKSYDIVYIYSALLPTESDLYSLNYLSKNNLTLKRIHGENAKALFKNLIPYTKYEDFYEDKKNTLSDLFDLSIFNFPTVAFSNDFVDFDIDDEVYKNKIWELLKNKLKTTLQLNSEETKS